MAAVATAAAQEDAFYAKIINLRDVVLAGTHPTFKLPETAIKELRSSSATIQSNGLDAQGAVLNGLGAAHPNASTANANQPAADAAPYVGLPGLFSTPPTNGQRPLAQTKLAGLDPIFLQKSDNLVREERRLKRQRIELALNESDKRPRYTDRDREAFADASSNIDIDSALEIAQQRVAPVSGLRPESGAAKTPGNDVSSFDENDYYSSQAESDWASQRGSDLAIGAFNADFERLEQPSAAAHSSSKSLGKRPVLARNALHAHADNLPASQARSQVDSAQLHGSFEEADADDEDEEYSPPDPAAFDSFREEDITMQDTIMDDAEDDDEYEPGEITLESTMVTPQYDKSATQASPNVPTFHNRLTHIAAPQPNRVSPLAMQKGPNIELELVNGRPEIVHKPQRSSKRTQQQQQASRASSASPSGPGNSGPVSRKEGRKAKTKRKREIREERHRKRQERQAGAQSPPSPAHRDTYIKPEPVSPPPFSNVPEINAYGHRYAPQTAPIEIDLESPRHPPQQQYAYAPTPRYEYAPRIASPQVVRVSSAAGYRPMQRDTQDLRRVASLQHAQRPASPPQAMYSPVASYQGGSQAYGQPRQMSVAPAPGQGYQDGAVRYVTTERQPEPLRLQEYRESSPAMMPPPSAPPPRRIVVDQYGNRYYAAEAAPPRASMAPPARAPEPEGYERAASRMSIAPQHSAPSAYYEQSMPPPPPVRRQAPQEQAVEYVDANGYRVREYSTRPAEPARYSVAPTSPVYQQAPQYEMMPPPPPSARQASHQVQYEQMPPPPAPEPPQQPTSPVYAPPPRAYSARPDGYEASNAYAPRQQSVAPVQYVRQDAPQQAPMRPMSVVPGSEYGVQTYQQRAPSYAPQPAVKYVDEYGREVMPQEVRQVSQYRY